MAGWRCRLTDLGDPLHCSSRTAGIQGGERTQVYSKKRESAVAADGFEKAATSQDRAGNLDADGFLTRPELPLASRVTCY